MSRTQKCYLSVVSDPPSDRDHPTDIGSPDFPAALSIHGLTAVSMGIIATSTFVPQRTREHAWLAQAPMASDKLNNRKPPQGLPYMIRVFAS